MSVRSGRCQELDRQPCGQLGDQQADYPRLAATGGRRPRQGLGGRLLRSIGSSGVAAGVSLIEQSDRRSKWQTGA
jgi:hypothetical protein